MVALAFSLTSMWGFLSSPLGKHRKPHSAAVGTTESQAYCLAADRRLALRGNLRSGGLTALTCELGSCCDEQSPA